MASLFTTSTGEANPARPICRSGSWILFLLILIAGGGAPIGSRRKNVVRAPISVSKSMVPPCFRTIIACANDKRWPVPLPIALVVKNGFERSAATTSYFAFQLSAKLN
jgi:hypothetical protein